MGYFLTMDADTFAIWMQRQGYRVYRTPSSYWYNAGPRVLQAFPYHWLIRPTREELDELMWKNGIAALRYSTPLDAPAGMVSYHVVLNHPYNLEMLRAQARNGVKKGMSVFSVEPISFKRLAEEGWILQRDTLERQDRLGSMKQEEWQRICLAADGLPGFEAWAALSSAGELAGALLTCRVGDTASVPYALSHSRFLRDHVNNVLFYVVNCALLSRPGINSIFFCLHSLDAPESVDEFKFRMSLIPRPVRQVVVFHPMLAPFAGKGTHSLLQKMVKRYPGSRLLAKGEGMLRFRMSGMLPLEDQEWPGCLKEYRDLRREGMTS